MSVTIPKPRNPGAKVTCVNCESTVASARFCCECGQQLVLLPLRLREIAATTWSSLSSLEGPTLVTVLGLLTGPGRVARAWIDGKRTRYLHPVKFLFVVSVIIALSYEPLMAARVAMKVSGAAVYTVGLEGISPVFSLFAIVLPVPFAVVMTVLSRPMRLGLPWLDWYVLGAYATGMGALLQLTFKLIVLPLPATWSRWLWMAEFALPIVISVWGAYHLVARNRRWHAVLMALLTPALVLFVVGGILRLSRDGT